MVTKATLDYAYRRLVNIFDETRVSKDPMERFVYENSFAQLPKVAEAQFKLRPHFIVVPRSIAEVQRAVQLGIELDIPIVPRGAASSIHGGAVSNVGGIVIDLRMLSRITKIDGASMTVSVEAGCTWKNLYDYLFSKGYFLPVYPDMAGSATIGGEISNGTIGIGALKYGPIGDLVRSLQVVRPEGDMIETGYEAVGLGHRNLNISPLYYGAEGSIGVITRATLGIFPLPDLIKPLSYAFDDFVGAAAAVARIPASGAQPYHIEFSDATHLTIEDSLGYKVPEAGGVVTVALEGSKDAVAAEAKAIDDFVATSNGRKLSDAEAAQQWNERLVRFRGRRLSGGMVVSRLLVPVARLREMHDEASSAARRLKMQVALRGYLADRSSVEVTPYWLTDDRSLKAQVSLAFVKKLHDIARRLGGHPMGLGFLLTFSMPRMHGAEADMIRDIKESLDPGRIMNRSKFIATGGRGLPIPLVEELAPEVPSSLVVLGLRGMGAVKKILPKDRYIPKRRNRAPEKEK